MSLEAFYSAVGGDLPTVRGRLVTDERITKFVGIFFQDPTYDNLVKSYGEADWEVAFRSAHTMKGTCRDMGFTALADRASELTEALRLDDAGNPHDVEASRPLYDALVAEYTRLREAKELL